ncbi:MAG: HNH endonuclease [Pseudomonadales bacterium]
MLSTQYQEKLSSLHVDRSSGHPKPHKVCLLLAIVDLIEDRRLSENFIKLTPALKEAFTKHFESLRKANDANKILTPFWHLRREGFWHFKVLPGNREAFSALVEAGSPSSESALFSLVEYAYLDPVLFAELQSPEARQQARTLLLSNLEDLSVQFHRWLLAMGKSEKTAKNYVGAIKGSLSNWAAAAHISDQNLIAIQSPAAIKDISDGLANYEVFRERDSRGKRMYSAALNAYKDFLADLCQMGISEDIESIITDPQLDQTQKAAMVNTRIGQGKFRDNLIQYWQGCAVTRYKQYDLLMASHIKPWRASSNEERLSHYNGILLIPNLDKAFDKGYITFDNKGDIQISDFIETPQTLGITGLLKIQFDNAHKDYLDYHRKKVFKAHQSSQS